MKSPRRVAAIERYAVLSSLAVQFSIFAILGWRNRPWINGDSWRYLALAQELIDSGRFGLTENGVFEFEGWRLPGYPLFLSAWLPLGGTALVVAVQGLLVVGAHVLVWRWTRRAFGVRVGLVFLFLSTGYPFVLQGATLLTAEAPTVFLLALSFWLLQQRWSFAPALSGLALGLTGLLRPTNFLLAAIVGVLILAVRRDLRRDVLFLVAVAAVALPFAAWNDARFGRLTPLPVISGGAGNLFLAVWETQIPSDSLLSLAMTLKPDAAVEQTELMGELEQMHRELGLEPLGYCINPPCFAGNDLKQRADVLFGQHARARIRQWPFAYVRRTVFNAFRNWFAWDMPGVSAAIVWPLRATGLSALVLGLVGLFAARRSWRRVSVIAPAAAMVLTALMHAPFYTEARYTLPLRLFLLAFAALGALTLFSRRRHA